MGPSGRGRRLAHLSSIWSRGNPTATRSGEPWAQPDRGATSQGKTVLSPGGLSLGPPRHHGHPAATPCRARATPTQDHGQHQSHGGDLGAEATGITGMPWAGPRAETPDPQRLGCRGGSKGRLLPPPSCKLAGCSRVHDPPGVSPPHLLSPFLEDRLQATPGPLCGPRGPLGSAPTARGRAHLLAAARCQASSAGAGGGGTPQAEGGVHLIVLSRRQALSLLEPRP